MTALPAGGFSLSLLVEITVSLAMLSAAVYMGILSFVCLAAHRAKVEMTRPREENEPPFMTGEDLL